MIVQRTQSQAHMNHKLNVSMLIRMRNEKKSKRMTNLCRIERKEQSNDTCRPHRRDRKLNASAFYSEINDCFRF